jgi:hypothetical protein
MEMTEETWVTVQQAAEATGYSVSNIYRIVNQELVQHQNLGGIGHILIKWRSLLDYKARQDARRDPEQRILNFLGSEYFRSTKTLRAHFGGSGWNKIVATLNDMVARGMVEKRPVLIRGQRTYSYRIASGVTATNETYKINVVDFHIVPREEDED